MSRYFLELSYKGTRYSGFQVQANALTVQSEVEKALNIFYHQPIELTGSSRTDAGVHALQNYFHFDSSITVQDKHIYNLNAILPQDIVLKRIVQVADDAHSRFLATSREYKYFVYKSKDPFLEDRAYYFPYTLSLEKLQEAAAVLMQYSDFTSFSKRNTQVKTFICDIQKSQWTEENGIYIYNVKANRFLRGMVRGLVGTMLRVGRGSIDIPAFRAIIEALDCSKADFSTPPQGLFLVEVKYPDGILP